MSQRRPPQGRSSLTTVTTVEEVRRAVDAARLAGMSVGLVPTMGALHEGHMALVERSAAQCDFTVVSIFVNPLQFGPSEDLDRYPKDLAADEALCRRHGVNLIFAPTAATMYPGRQSTTVAVADLTTGLCGAARPGHFEGVTTVVAKLFNIVQPDRAYFGQKDYQQLVVIRRMAENLNFPVQVRAVPIVRERDGLAMSSRNRYLSPAARRAACGLSRALTAARQALIAGERDPATLTAIIRAELQTEPLIKEDYIAVVDADNLEPLSYGRDWLDGADGDGRQPARRILLALAAFVDGARLIDNLVFPAIDEEQPESDLASVTKRGG